MKVNLTLSTWSVDYWSPRILLSSDTTGWFVSLLFSLFLFPSFPGSISIEHISSTVHAQTTVSQSTAPYMTIQHRQRGKYVLAVHTLGLLMGNSDWSDSRSIGS